MTFSRTIWPIIDLRWRELGYASFSVYITGLVRYDLMIGRPGLFTAADSDPKIQKALDMADSQERLNEMSRAFAHCLGASAVGGAVKEEREA